jgi:phenylpropionate dioxygenase-like ring-hydroxylating dioxygenase large terminal subunit
MRASALPQKRSGSRRQPAYLWYTGLRAPSMAPPALQTFRIAMIPRKAYNKVRQNSGFFRKAVRRRAAEKDEAAGGVNDGRAENEGVPMIRNQWYAILPSKAVKKNRIVGVKRLNLDLALFRDSAGTIGCVADQCTHRGAALSRGKIVENCVQCPFHGLRFDTGGRCVLIPADGKASAADISRFNVKSWPVRESGGIVYLWYGDPDQMSGEPPFFREDIDSSWTYSEFADHWNSHYSRCIENQLDVVHLPFVHHNTIGRGHKTLVNGPKIEFVPSGFLTSANNEVDSGQAPKPAEECVIKKTYLKFLFPNIWMNHVSDKIKIVIYFAPVDEENTVLYIRFYNQISGFRPMDGLIAQLGKAANRIVERQDKRVVVTQKPKASAYRSSEKLLAGDGPVIQYRRIRDQLQNE